MFEKVAEKYGNSFEWTNDDRIIDYSKQGFKKGAEFGYNKGKEEIKEIIRELLLSDTRKGSDWTGYLIDLKERAEKFIKDSEVEK